MRYRGELVFLLMKQGMLGSNYAEGLLSLLKNRWLIACERIKLLNSIMDVMSMLMSLENNSIIDSSAPLWCGVVLFMSQLMAPWT